MGDSVPFDEVSSLSGKLIWVRPEVSDAEDGAVLLEVEETQPGLDGAVCGRELDPAGCM
jgi:hypothetical protein